MSSMFNLGHWSNLDGTTGSGQVQLPADLLATHGVVGGNDQHLSPRWFVARDAQSSSAPLLIQPRNAMSFLRGPMTRAEIRKGREWRESLGREPQLAAAAE